ncbi:MAG: hypothetical protein AAFQ74_07530 [Cyanobacteria bacterium J06623_4]
MANRDACVNDNQHPFLVKDGVEFRCSFIRSVEHEQPVLIARVEIDIPAASEELGSTLWRHADELNIRLPMLSASARMTNAHITSTPIAGASVTNTQINSHRTTERAGSERSAAVKENCSLVLSGLLCGEVTAQSLSDFLHRMTRDFRVFLAYAQAHGIPLRLTPTEMAESA